MPDGEQQERKPLRKLNGAAAERYRSNKDQMEYFLGILHGGTTGDTAVNYVIKNGFAKAGKRGPNASDLCSRIEGVRSLRKELELHRDEPVLAAQKGKSFEILRWGYVVKTGDVFTVERNDSTLKIVPYGRDLLAINTGDNHWGYDKTIYDRIYELRMNLPFQPKFKHVFGDDAEKAIKEIEKKCADL
jgi:hypothetical protein